MTSSACQRALLGETGFVNSRVSKMMHGLRTPFFGDQSCGTIYRSGCFKMKSSLSAIYVAVNSAGIFVSVCAWVFIVWVPILVAFVAFCVEKWPVGESLGLLAYVTAIFFPLGLLLKWMARGLVLRKKLRTFLTTFILSCLGLRIGLSPLVMEAQSDSPAIDRYLIGIVFLSAAVVAALGLTKRARGSDG
jgi:hypothetical protein